SVVTLDGTTEPGLLVTLENNGAMARADAAGRFAFPGVSLASGSTSFTVSAADEAGNVGEFSRSFTRLEMCGFAQGLDGWITGQSGGTSGGQGGVSVQDDEALLREGDSFRVTLEKDFIVPAAADLLTFTYDRLDFDTTATSFMKDAFEVSLVDTLGQPLVHTFTTGRDAFFNLAEGQPAAT